MKPEKYDASRRFISGLACGAILILSILLSSFSFYFPLFFLLSLWVVHLVRNTPVFLVAYRELRTLAASPLGYVVGLCFVILLWYLYAAAVERLLGMQRMSPYSLAPLSAFFHADSLSLALLVIVPTITMKLVSEEKNAGTYELVLTCPLEEWHWVTGKFIGAWLYYILLWIPSLLPVFLLSRMGKIDFGQVFSAYFYLFLCGAGFLSIGLAISCLFSNQLASYMATFTLLLPFHSHLFLKELGGGFLSVLHLRDHLEMACRGTVHSTPFFLFLTITFFFLDLASKTIESRKWLPVLLQQERTFFIQFALIFSFFFPLIVWASLRWEAWKIVVATLLLAPLSWRTFLSIRKEKKSRLVYGAHVFLRLCSLLVILLVANYFAYRYHARLDWSQNRAFTLDERIVALLQKEIPPGDQIKALALIGYTDTHSHEHTERDNERYFLLKEAFRKMAESLNRPGETRFAYEFVHPAAHGEKVSSYVRQERDRQSRLARIKNDYGVTGYREVLFVYRNRHFVLSDADLFDRRLERSQLPKLLVLWRKIYETGGIVEPPPSDEESAFEKLKQIANPEMLGIFPRDDFEQVLIGGAIGALRGVPRNVYATQGKGEKIITGTMANDYRSAYRLHDVLRRRNFNVRPWTISEGQSVPEDCHILLILGSDSHLSFSSSEIDVLRNYLRRGGKMVVLVSPHSDGGLSSLFQEYGIESPANEVVRHYLGGMQGKVQKTRHIQVEGIGEPALADLIEKMQEQEQAYPAPFYFLDARMVETTEKTPPGIICQRILPSSPRESAQYLDRPGMSREGPFSLGAASRKISLDALFLPFSFGLFPARFQGAVHEKTKKMDGGTLVVIGNSSFCSDTPFYESGMEVPIPHILLASNRFLLPAILERLSLPISIPQAEKKRPIIFEPSPSFQEIEGYCFYSHGVLCFLLLMLGVWVWRRGRQTPNE